MSRTVHNARQFSWSGNVGVSETSTLGLPPGESPDVLIVRSPRTARVINFSHTVTRERGDDGVCHVYTSPAGVVLHVYED